MSAITFNAMHRKGQIRKQLETALVAYREMLDALVSNQMRRTAAEAEQAHLRRQLATQPGRPQ
jgi:hypothetical protein